MRYDFIFLLALMLGIALNLHNHNRLPSGVHAWSQADKYSIAYHFLESRSIFHAATHSLQTPDGRVGCEFPLTPFIAAKATSLLNKPHILPFIFRFVTWAFWSLAFVYVLRALIQIAQIPSLPALLLCILLFSSPTLLFYSYNFQSDVPAFALIITAFFYFLKYIEEKHSKSIILSWLLLAIASLIKSSALIYFMAFNATLFILFSRAHKAFLNPRTLLLGGASTAFILLLFYYNKFYYVDFNKANYTYVFLTGPQHLRSFSDLKGLFMAFNKWKLEYFNIIQWLFFVLISLTGTLIYSKSNPIQHVKLYFLDRPYRYLTLFTLVFLLLFIFIMGRQYSDHDYYIIATFFPLVIGALCFIIGRLYRGLIVWPKIQTWSWVLLLIASSTSVLISVKQYQNRQKDFYKHKGLEIHTPIQWLKSGESTLDGWGIRQNSNIAVLYGFSSNIHLVYFNRSGLIFTEEEMGRTNGFFEERIHKIKPQYWILENQYIETLFMHKPQIKHAIINSHSNEHFTVLEIDFEVFSKYFPNPVPW